jgi:predicted ATP-dependent endonuclease of OLD family
MQGLIKEIELMDENYSFIIDADSQVNRLKSLSKINIFVGENNSGKSRLLRSLLANKLNYVLDSSFIEDYNNYVDDLKIEFEDYFVNNAFFAVEGLNIQNFWGIEGLLNNLSKIEYLNYSSDFYINFTRFKNVIENMVKSETVYESGKMTSQIGKDLLQIIEAKSNIFKGNLEDYLKPIDFKKIYVPILRGLKPLYLDENGFEYKDVYKARIQKDYFNEDSEINNSIEIFTGISYYNYIKRYLLGNHNERKVIPEYEKYLAESFFDGKEVTLIPSELNGLITIKVGNEMERPIHELGDGIQSIIILTLPLFLNKGRNLLVFIEEPEKLLHPGLQRKLIETLLKQDGFENYQYFMTTHSNHFLDITLDMTMDFPKISIYALTKKIDMGDSDQKEPHFFIENLKHGDTSALDLLGVQNSSVFLSNCTIWVEGITDRLYFRHYLDLYFDYHSKSNNCVKFKEDFHYSFVEYGGGNITHWSFLDNEKCPINVERLCGKLFLIADKDEGKDKRHEELTEKLGDRFCLLKCKEVENLISKKVLLKVIKDYEGCIPNIDYINEADYKKVRLGRFIDKRLGANRKRIGSYATKSGTVSDKLNFCKKVIENTNDWDDLSNETKKICERIYRFIAKNNDMMSISSSHNL